MGFLKSHKRSKWYKCFRPKKHNDYPFEPVPCLKNGGKESNINLLRNNILMALSDEKLGSFSDGDDRLSKKCKSRRSLSRAFKAVLFPIYSAKKNRSRKSDQEKSFRSRSDSSSSSKLDKIFSSFRGKKSSSPSMKKDSSDCSVRTDSSGSSLFSSSVTPDSSSLSSSRSSSISSNSRSSSGRRRSFAIEFKQLERKPSPIYSRKSGGCCNPILGLYFLLICLVALVLCGKALAIFCTSTCLFLIPCRFKGVDQSSSVHNNVDSIDIDSDEYKKKVIMEGLLERSHTTRVL